MVQEGKPVYVADDGKEIVFDYPATLATISRLNGEARGHRERAEAAEAALKPFEGITDPAAARTALTTVKNLDDKKLVDAGEVERVKTEAIAAVEAKYGPVVKERDKLRGDLVAEIIGGSFGRSKFITDKLVIPSDLAQAAFGRHFALDDGKIVAKDASGNRIYSRARPGEVANFDEALESIVDAYPHRDTILKGTGASGGGAPPSGGGGAGGKQTITRAQWEALPPMDRATAAREKIIGD